MTTRDEVDDVLAAFSKAVANKDAVGLANFYSENAKFLPPGAPLVEGRAGIKDFCEQLFAAGFAGLDLENIEVLEGGDLVVDVGRYTMSFAPEGSDRGKYIAVYRRQADGSLIIVADTFNSDTPAA